MKRRLFLTGDIGAGKSTAIAAALEPCLPGLGGFLTRRNTDPSGKPGFFTLETPDGSQRAVFLDLTQKTPQIYLETFDTLGISSLQGERLILDEIGGVELLSPVFWHALEEILGSQTPIIGVVKGKNSSDALAAALGFQEPYRLQIQKLWDLLEQDENTLVYACETCDETALALAQQWVREYCL